ncbi:YciI family protein [Tenacibaculum sp. nBUS_03]|uniref:YciI family protein n=1 Tax=Tenacibaculum sp. nBUS_03 TaxID=3395320 RepID=UPI003EB9AE9E
MFIINFNFLKPLEETNKYTELHKAYVTEQYEKNKFIIGGAKKPRNVGVMLLNECLDEEILAILENNPLIFKGLAEYNLIKF